MSSFGLFANPERRLLFGLNDFDETVPGPFDWDVWRLPASFVIASRELGLQKPAMKSIVQAVLDTCHQQILALAEMDTLDVWYHQMTSETLLKLGGASKLEKAAIEKPLPKAAVTWSAMQWNGLTARQAKRCASRTRRLGCTTRWARPSGKLESSSWAFSSFLSSTAAV